MKKLTMILAILLVFLGIHVSLLANFAIAALQQATFVVA
jgi:hypothetical protein